MKIKCIKGFIIDGGSFPIMRGEVFELAPYTDLDEMSFIAQQGASLCPGMGIDFTSEQLCNNFELIVGY